MYTILSLSWLKWQYNTFKNKKSLFTYIKNTFYISVTLPSPILVTPHHNPQQQKIKDLQVVLSTDMAGQLDVFGIMVTCLACIAPKLASSRRPVRLYLAASCSTWTACTWRHKSYTPYVCAILWTRLYKGPLTDEELSTLLVLMYLAESHCPQLVPLGPLQPPFSTLCGGLPPTVDLMWQASPQDVKGPISTIISANLLVGKDPSNLPTASNPSNCLLLLSNSPGEGKCTLPESAPSMEPLLWPSLGITFVLAIWNGAATSQRSWWAFQNCRQPFHFDVNG